MIYIILFLLFAMIICYTVLFVHVWKFIEKLNKKISELLDYINNIKP